MEKRMCFVEIVFVVVTSYREFWRVFFFYFETSRAWERKRELYKSGGVAFWLNFPLISFLLCVLYIYSNVSVGRLCWIGVEYYSLVGLSEFLTIHTHTYSFSSTESIVYNSSRGKYFIKVFSSSFSIHFFRYNIIW